MYDILYDAYSSPILIRLSADDLRVFDEFSLILQIQYQDIPRVNHQLINVIKWVKNFSKEGIWFRKYSGFCVDQLSLKKTRNSYTSAE